MRRQVYELTPADLEQCPIWEHALDEEGDEGQDEATVKPRPDLGRADPAEGMLLVRAELVAADGTRFVGYVYPEHDDEPGLLQPTIVTDAGQVNFWLGGVAPREGELEGRYALLGKTPSELFPVRYRAVVPHDGVQLIGTIPAFRGYRSFDDRTVVEYR
jgi:hypothetical protein